MLSFRNTKTDLVIAWESEDKTRTATFKVPKKAPEEEQVAAMQRALSYLMMQTGAMTQMRTPATTPIAPSPGPMQVQSGPATALPVPMMPPGSLSDRPADGGPPKNQQFWESMPTTQLPAMLQTEQAGGWEIIPENER